MFILNPGFTQERRVSEPIFSKREFTSSWSNCYDLYPYDEGKFSYLGVLWGWQRNLAVQGNVLRKCRQVTVGLKSPTDLTICQACMCWGRSWLCFHNLILSIIICYHLVRTDPDLLLIISVLSHLDFFFSVGAWETHGKKSALLPCSTSAKSQSTPVNTPTPSEKKYRTAYIKICNTCTF